MINMTKFWYLEKFELPPLHLWIIPEPVTDAVINYNPYTERFRGNCSYEIIEIEVPRSYSYVTTTQGWGLTS